MLISLLAPALLLAADGACACACVLFLVVRRRRSRSLGVLGGAPRRRQNTALAHYTEPITLTITVPLRLPLAYNNPKPVALILPL